MYRVTAINGDSQTVIHMPSAEDTIRLAAGKLAEEVNAIPSFNFSLLPSNPCFESGLNERKTVIEVCNTLTGENEFEGTVLRLSAAMNSSGRIFRSVVCEGFLGFLCDSIQPYHHYENTGVEDFLTALLTQHNAQMPEEKRIYLGACDISGDSTASKTTAYRTTLEEIRENLITRIGGEIRVRKVEGRLVLDYLTQYGVTSSTVIELADNLRSLEISSDPSNVVTRLIPLGCQLNDETAERLTIADVNQGCIYIDDAAGIAKYGVICGTVVFDDITVPANLKARAETYLANNNRVKKAYAAEVLDLSVLDPSKASVRAGNTYRFRHSLLDTDEDLRILKRTVDIVKAPYKPAVEIGDKYERITDIAAHSAQLLEYELPKQKYDILASAKATATALINAGFQGYVVANDNEICIMDTDDKATATKVWRWNSGGFGYSNTGYNGTYGTAITMNGAIVADFITAGILTGLEINNGNGTFHVNSNGEVEASAIEITGGKININTSSADYDAIYLNYGDVNSRMRADGFAARNTSTKNRADVTAGGITVYSDYDNNTIACSITSGGNISGSVLTVKSGTDAVIVSSSGISGFTNYSPGSATPTFTINSLTNTITAGTVSAATVRGGELKFNWNSSTYDVGTLIAALWNEVFGGGM